MTPRIRSAAKQIILLLAVAGMILGLVYSAGGKDWNAILGGVGDYTGRF